jgi:hypothetical protein
MSNRDNEGSFRTAQAFLFVIALVRTILSQPSAQAGSYEVTGNDTLVVRPSVMKNPPADAVRAVGVEPEEGGRPAVD